MSSFQLQNSEVLARLKPFGISFEKSLNDLIKGIRAHTKESPESLGNFLDVAIQECRSELTTTDLETKAMAILKLAYLEMYGFDMSWCNFQILEVMSSSKFQQKRIGYLAAIQSFKNEQDLLILATNQFKKDLNSHNHVDIGLALSGIATIVTPSLAKDINDDVLMKLNHSKPYIRKKAILAMYKIFLQYPESLRLNFNRVIEKLDDSEIAVVSATVNVICEISKKNPNIFINYLPKFFAILEDTKNNWLIIRILKLFQSLSKVEPRMKKKILPTIIDLMLRTQASSLIYECINCIVSGQMLSADSSKDKETAKLCINQLKLFFLTNDSNLKFVGLIALINTLKIFPILINDVEGISEIVLECLNDRDLIIKRKALEVSNYLVNEDNITEVVKIMLMQLVPDNNMIDDMLKLEVTLKILQIASQNNYVNIPNFRWYVAVLKDVINLTLLPVEGATNSGLIASHIANEISTEVGKEFKNLATKVPSVRSYLLQNVVLELVQDVRLLDSSALILKDLYWILGEYISELKVTQNDDSDDDSDSDSDEEDAQVMVLDIDKKIKVFNTLINHQIDKKLGLTSNIYFPVSAKLINLHFTSVVAVLIQALVKLYNGIATDYINNFATTNGQLPLVKYHELCYHLYRLIGFLSNWENHPNYEVQERALSWLEFLKLILEAMTDNDFTDIKKLEETDLKMYKDLPIAKGGNSESESESESEDDDEEEEEEEEEENDDSEDDSESEDDGYENLVSSDEEGNSKPSKLTLPIQEEEYNPFAENEESESKNLTGGNEAEEETQEQENQQEDDNGMKQLPMLLTHVLPSFFTAYPLNPVAKNAQRSVGVPGDLDLNTQIHSPDFKLEQFDDDSSDNYELYLSEVEDIEPLIHLSSDEPQEKKKERLERLKDDPYYLDDDDVVKTKKKSKSKKIKSESISPEVESENASITNTIVSETDTDMNKKKKQTKKKKSNKLKKEKVLILDEETIVGESNITTPIESTQIQTHKEKKKPTKKNTFKIDSSNLDNFDLVSNDSETQIHNDKEYEIDLEALREKLKKTTVEPKDKDKEAKSKKKSKKSKKTSEEGKSTTAESNGVEPLKPKKVKKKKAVILE
ncbi:hypothetical protein MG5_02707 [Candida albicans P57072]|nr:hypothetical protein MG5_02707 [Candida albicans P57072]